MESRVLFYIFLAYACHSITVPKRLFISADVVKNCRLLTKQYAHSFITPGVTLHERKLENRIGQEGRKLCT